MSSCQKMRQNIGSQHLAWPSLALTDGFMISNQCCCCCCGGDTVTYRLDADTCPALSTLAPAPALTRAIKINPSLCGPGELGILPLWTEEGRRMEYDIITTFYSS